MFAAGDTETVTVIRPPGKDTYGDPVDEDSTETALAGVLFAPGGTSERNDGANQVRVDGTVYAPPDVDVLPSDRLRIRGEVYEVAGAPQRWGSTLTVIGVRRITG